jgi:Fe2+ transport system protein FeoA
MSPGNVARVVSLDDRDEKAVGVLAQLGILPGASVRVLSSTPANMRVRCGDRSVGVRRQHAAMVRVAT